MTVDWKKAQDGIESFVQAVAGATPVFWDFRADAGKQRFAPYVTLRLAAEQPVGVDDLVQTVNGSDQLEYEVRGGRHFTCEMQVRTRNQEHSMAARNLIERLRAALMHPVYRQILDDAGVVFVQTLASRTVDVSHQGRAESVAVLDVRFATTSVLTDSSQTLDYVASAEVSGTTKRGDGSTAFTMPATEIPEP